MWTVIIVFFLTWIIVTIVSKRKHRSYLWDVHICNGLIAAIFAIFIALILTNLIGAAVYGSTEWRPIRSVPLMNISDNMSVHGDFFLGFGNVNGEGVYSWYEKVGDNTFVRKDVRADRAYVHYTTGVPHYVISEQFRKTKGYIHPWLFNSNPTHPTDNYKWYDFYVPRGTIAPEYKLDAKG